MFFQFFFYFSSFITASVSGGVSRASFIQFIATDHIDHRIRDQVAHGSLLGDPVSEDRRGDSQLRRLQEMDLFPPQFPKVIDGLLYLNFIPRAARADEMTGRKKLPVVFPRRRSATASVPQMK